jgi:hypothetical protein
MKLIGLTESKLLVKTPTLCRTMGQELRKINKRSVFFYGRRDQGDEGRGARSAMVRRAAAGHRKDIKIRTKQEQ